MAYRRVARRKARKYGLDPKVFERQIQRESGFQAHIGSPAGAQGIAQIMPATARGWGVDPDNPRQALDAAAKNMASYVKKYGGYENALRAYNAGPGAIESSKGYAETNNYVKTILGGKDPGKLSKPDRGGGGGGGSSSGRRGRPGRVNTTITQTPGVSNKTARGQLVASFLEDEDSDALDFATQFKALKDIPGTSSTSRTRTPGRPGRAPARGGDGDGGGQPTSLSTGKRGSQGGRVTFNPGANRPGVPTTPKLQRALDHLSVSSGRKIAVGTGTNHSQMTTSGNVSDHWSGNGADIPLAGNQLTKRGRQALVAYGMSPAEAKKAKGGIYNLNWHGKRVQVIFNTTEGGNHWNHLHVGVR